MQENLDKQAILGDKINERLPLKARLAQTYRLYFPYFIALVVLALILWHIFDLLIGDKSLMVLLTLWEQEDLLEASVKFYKQQNAYLQKEIFELVGG